MHSFSSRIWTRVAVSISYDDNHYTTDTYKLLSSCLYQMIFYILKSQRILLVSLSKMDSGLCIIRTRLPSPTRRVYSYKPFKLIFYIRLLLLFGSLAKWVDRSPMVQETWVQSLVASYQRL